MRSTGHKSPAVKRQILAALDKLFAVEDKRIPLSDVGIMTSCGLRGLTYQRRRSLTTDGSFINSATLRNERTAIARLRERNMANRKGRATPLLGSLSHSRLSP